jgi:ABC-type Fe3+/spermidine/putrescine transport system ATPase subunit
METARNAGKIDYRRDDRVPSPEGAPSHLADEAIVSLRGVTKTFGAATAVENVSIDIKQGEIVALLGPSGCGKTTPLRSLAGLEQIDGGEIWIHGRRVADTKTSLAPHFRGIGFVFQSYALWPHMTVLKNVTYGLRTEHIAVEESNRRAREMLETVGLSGLESRLPAELSGGQQQRVALARSLVVRPSVLLLDEPLSNLDAALRTRMRKEIRTILKDVGITSVFVTHDQREAFSICDRIVLMNKGRIVQVGTPEELYESPVSLLSASLLGEANIVSLDSPPIVSDTSMTALASTTDGSTVEGTPGPRCVPGPETKAMIRPEHIRINAGPTKNTWPGKVISRVYEGTGVDLVVHALGQDLGARVDIGHDVTEGSEITVSVDPSQLLYLNPDESTP